MAPSAPVRGAAQGGNPNRRRRMLRERQRPPPDIFPVEPWSLGAIRFDRDLALEFLGQAETMLTLANGYLGIRGMQEEGRPVWEAGVFLNGFHELRRSPMANMPTGSRASARAS